MLQLLRQEPPCAELYVLDGAGKGDLFGADLRLLFSVLPRNRLTLLLYVKFHSQLL